MRSGLGLTVISSLLRLLVLKGAAPGRPSFIEHSAVNISARQFSDDDFLDKIRATIEKYKIETQRLKLELTESCLV
jgi:EAL domain-containing protein (putative c-di-GMP-specific phosphodiesterase class I)